MFVIASLHDTLPLGFFGKPVGTTSAKQGVPLLDLITIIFAY